MSLSEPAVAQPHTHAEPKPLVASIATSIPVALTVLATILAGLSSSEMTRAQYFRTIAAQQQSKAGDQWAFYQARRIRAEINTTSVVSLMALGMPGPIFTERIGAAARHLRALYDAAELANSVSHFPTTEAASDPDAPGQNAHLAPHAEHVRQLSFLIAKTLTEAGTSSVLSDPLRPMPSAKPVLSDDRNILAAMEAMRAHQSDGQMAPLLGRILDGAIEKVIDANQHAADDFDKALNSAPDTLVRLTEQVGQASGWAREYQRTVVSGAGIHRVNDDRAAEANALTAEFSGIFRDLSEQSLRANLARYQRQSVFNQTIAELYEVQVHQADVDSDRHRARSTYFFIGMLVAQAGVTIATLSLSLHRRNILLSLAAAAGLVAVSLSAYIFMAL